MKVFCVQISYSNWNHMYSEPNGMERENCLEVYGDNFLWNDNFCNDTYLYFICEKPQQDLTVPNPDKWIGLNDLVTNHLHLRFLKQGVAEG